jgi:hypothetical protein
VKLRPFAIVRSSERNGNPGGRQPERQPKESGTVNRKVVIRFLTRLWWIYCFEPDFFQQNLLRIVDDVIKGSIKLWPMA